MSYEDRGTQLLAPQWSLTQVQFLTAPPSCVTSVSCLTSLCPHFLIFTMEVIIGPISRDAGRLTWAHTCKIQCLVHRSAVDKLTLHSHFHVHR